ncbi:S41 family peptidase [Chitinophaga sp. Hz27]|uniref:S41 family peptidase n=1 Tax=Chitinophaga sp. Hz27 TaxID=3347169 RepID=UPI0035D82AD2
MKRLFILITLLFSAWYTMAQLPFNAATKQSVVKRLQDSLQANYICLDTARRMSDYIGERLQSGAYNKINTPMEFAQILTTDLYHIYQDGHLAIKYDPRVEAPQDTSAAMPPIEVIPDDSYRNWGFKKVEILYGNVGYIMLNQFADTTAEGLATVRAVFNVLRHTDAIILDLRNNGGGAPEMVQYICSFFLPPNTHLNDLYDRRNKHTEHYYTSLTDTSHHFLNVPLYILTSQRTYSAAEECSYNLQSQKRATIVGGTTGGGAHLVDGFRLGDGFIGNIPFASAINAVTHTSWEHIGVQPDIKVAEQTALQTAVIDYLDKKIQEPQAGQLKKSRQWARDMAAAQLHPPKTDANVLKQYAGLYGNRQVKFENGQLYITNQGGVFMPLIPVSDKVFRIDGFDYIKIIFSDDIKTVTMAYDEGFMNILKRKS